MKRLVPGRGEFFEVRIEAVADPAAPDLDAELAADSQEIQERYEQLIDQLRNVSAAEARDQVYRRLQIALCNRCYQSWIENPSGSPDAE